MIRHLATNYTNLHEKTSFKIRVNWCNSWQSKPNQSLNFRSQFNQRIGCFVYIITFLHTPFATTSLLDYLRATMTLDKQISSLLYLHDCIIIPGFGGFVANQKPSFLNPAHHIFSPPSKRIAFNSSLRIGDGLLANHISKTLNLLNSSPNPVRSATPRTLSSTAMAKCSVGWARMARRTGMR